MLQNYGIDVAGDVLGGIVILVIYLVIRAHSPRGAYGWLIASWALSMLGSLMACTRIRRVHGPSRASGPGRTR